MNYCDGLNIPFDFDPYCPFFGTLGIEPIYEGELYGLDHEAAKKMYLQMLAKGFYDDLEDEDYL